MALALVNRAEQELLAPAADGKPQATVRELRDAIEFAMNLLVKLPKLKPEDDDEDVGVSVLRAAMQHPGQIVERLQANPEFRQALRDKGWLPLPEKINHRPSRAQQAERAAYEARKGDTPAEDDEEDGLLASMLSSAQGDAK